MKILRDLLPIRSRKASLRYPFRGARGPPTGARRTIGRAGDAPAEADGDAKNSAFPQDRPEYVINPRQTPAGGDPREGRDPVDSCIAAASRGPAGLRCATATVPPIRFGGGTPNGGLPGGRRGVEPQAASHTGVGRVDGRGGDGGQGRGDERQAPLRPGAGPQARMPGTPRGPKAPSAMGPPGAGSA